MVYQLARALMSFFRAVPSFIWGLIYVTAVGLGAFPGVLAIITRNMGVMGKLWSEAMEETNQGPVEALRSAGASSAQTATHAVLPSVIPQFTSLRRLVEERPDIEAAFLQTGPCPPQISAFRRDLARAEPRMCRPEGSSPSSRTMTDPENAWPVMG